MQKWNPPATRAVANWVMIGVLMLLIQILLGGITRLTGSGLSITEWNFGKGVIPPLGDQQWMNEFNKYKLTQQYLLLNSGFSLQDFKFIFFWEWFHRLWARLVALVFVVGFCYLIAKRKMKAEMIRPLLILFLLGALQGAIGWIMVASGLDSDAVYVKPTRLALHFIFALGLISYAFWFALQLIVPPQETGRIPSLRSLNFLILFFLFFQLLFGALMAGHKAAAAAPTWPDINGDLIPSAVFARGAGFLPLIEHKITIHFVHRSIAYILFLLVLAWTWRSLRIPNASAFFRHIRLLPLALTITQIMLGIFTVLTSRSIVPNHWQGFEWLALFHQFSGMCLLLLIVFMFYLSGSRKSGF